MNPRLVGVVGAALAGVGLAVGLVEHALVRQVRRGSGGSDEMPEGIAGATERVVVTGDGAHLRVFEQGEGRPIVLVHGVTLAASLWAYQLAELAGAGFRVLAFDQRGHGASGVGGGGLSLDRLAVDLGEVLEQLELDDAVVVGHSLGGMVVLRFLTGGLASATGRRRVGAVGLVATTAHPLGGRNIPGLSALPTVTRPLAGPADWVAARLPGPTLPGNDFGLLATRLAFGDSPSPSQVEITQRVAAAAPASVTGEVLLEIVRFDARSGLPSIELPTTVVVGGRDILTPPRQARAIADAIPGAGLVVLDGCGHMVPLERHAELSAVIAELAGRSPMVEAAVSR